MEKKKYSRKYDREWVFKILFASMFHPEKLDTIYENIRDDYNVHLTAFGKDYLKRIEKIFNTDELIHLVERNLTKVKYIRLNKIVQTLLQMGAFELLYCPDVPPEVIINEILVVGRQYIDSRDRRLLNSVLDKIYNDLKDRDLLYSGFVKPLHEK